MGVFMLTHRAVILSGGNEQAAERKRDGPIRNRMAPQMYKLQSTPSACGWAGRAQPLRDVLASARRASSPLRVDVLLSL
jgi:hypothetical protein